jgi:hypothetical protein
MTTIQKPVSVAYYKEIKDVIADGKMSCSMVRSVQ